MYVLGCRSATVFLFQVHVAPHVFLLVIALNAPEAATSLHKRQPISASNWAVVKMECAKVGQLISIAACIAARLKAAVASLTNVT